MSHNTIQPLRAIVGQENMTMNQLDQLLLMCAQYVSNFNVRRVTGYEESYVTGDTLRLHYRAQPFNAM
jgi:hypothetical protein